METLSTGTTTTFADLCDECAAIERALTALGVARGASVVSFVGNRPIFFSLVAACMEAGAALIPLGEATDIEATSLIEQAGAGLRVCDLAVERSHGTFARSFSLPNTVDPNKVQADYKDGVLTIRLPFREEAKPKQIKVNVAA